MINKHVQGLGWSLGLTMCLLVHWCKNPVLVLACGYCAVLMVPSTYVNLPSSITSFSTSDMDDMLALSLYNDKALDVERSIHTLYLWSHNFFFFNGFRAHPCAFIFLILWFFQVPFNLISLCLKCTFITMNLSGYCFTILF